jgi:hypothetical protein
VELPDESSVALLRRALHISTPLAERLVAHRLVTIEEVAYLPLAELVKASGLPNAEALALRSIADKYLLNESLGDDLGP